MIFPEENETAEALVEEQTETKRDEPKQEEQTELKALPGLQFYQKTYANSCGNNDAKAIKLFKEYESREKLQRLRQELIAVSKGRASELVCNKLIGLTRKNRCNGYDKWALMVLNMLNSKG